MSEKFFLHNLHFKTNVNKNFQNRYFGEKQKLFFTDRKRWYYRWPKTIKASITFYSLNCNGGFLSKPPGGIFLAVAQV